MSEPLVTTMVDRLRRLARWLFPPNVTHGRALVCACGPRIEVSSRYQDDVDRVAGKFAAEHIGHHVNTPAKDGEQRG